MSTWASWNRRQRTFAIGVATVAIVSIVYALDIRYLLLGPRGVTAVDDIGEAVAAALASAACGWASTRSTGRDRLAWALMSISTGLWAAGETAWSYFEVGLKIPVPYPSLADVGFLAAVPFAFLGIRAFWSAPRGPAAHWRVWVDGLIVATALTSTARPF